MSTKYQHGDHVPTEVLAKRLGELSDAVVARMNRDTATFEREFTCRIPAELDRDADLVLSKASKRLIEKDKRIAELESKLDEYARQDLVWFSRHEVKGLDKEQTGVIDLDGLRLEMQAKGIEDALNSICGNGKTKPYLKDRLLRRAEQLRNQAKEQG